MSKYQIVGNLNLRLAEQVRAFILKNIIGSVSARDFGTYRISEQRPRICTGSPQSSLPAYTQYEYR